MPKMRNLPLILVFFLLFSAPFLKMGFNLESSQVPQRKKEPLSESSKQWLDEVVPYIITKAEKEFFLSLPNEIQRGKFIESFWKSRDPNPDTPECTILIRTLHLIPLILEHILLHSSIILWGSPLQWISLTLFSRPLFRTPGE